MLLRLLRGALSGATHTPFFCGRPEQCPKIKRTSCKARGIFASRACPRTVQLRKPRPVRDHHDGPTRNSTKYTEKIPPGPKFRNPQKKIPQNTEKMPKAGIFWSLEGIFRYFQGIFGANFGSPEIRTGGYFFGIFRGNSGSDHLRAL